ncbi:MAG: DUF4402 domain-containing protein [Alphaproteobacteria bacterium]|nr:DUF4402 domain-containing protein [Alphaproteobacteria bacterium]
MRKYFLLSAVALLVASTANATTEYAEVTARATIQVAGIFECSDLDFGTIVVKQNNGISTIFVDSSGYDEPDISGDIISVTGESMAGCYSDEANYNMPTSVELSAEGKTKKLTVELNTTETDIGGKLTIPAQIESGTYTGSFTVTSTY